MSTISRSETGYRELDFKIAAALGAGMTKEAAAEFAGCNRTTVYDRLATNGEFMEFASATVRSATAASLAIATEKIKRRFEGMYDKAVGIVEKTMDVFEDDPRLAYQAADKVIDRVAGQPTKRIEQKSTSEHLEVHAVVPIPADVFRGLIDDIRGTQRVIADPSLEGPIEDIPEADIVESFDPEPVAGSDGAPGRAAEDAELQYQGV